MRSNGLNSPVLFPTNLVQIIMTRQVLFGSFCVNCEYMLFRDATNGSVGASATRQERYIFLLQITWNKAFWLPVVMTRLILEVVWMCVSCVCVSVIFLRPLGCDISHLSFANSHLLKCVGYFRRKDPQRLGNGKWTKAAKYRRPVWSVQTPNLRYNTRKMGTKVRLKEIFGKRLRTAGLK